MKQNTHNRIYITIIIHKHKNKNIMYRIKYKHTKHTPICVQLYKIEPKEYERSIKLYLICIFSNNYRRPVTKTFTLLHYTCRHFNTLLLLHSSHLLHFFPYTSLFPIYFTFSHLLHFFPFTSLLAIYFTSCHLLHIFPFTSLLPIYFTSSHLLHFLPFTSLLPIYFTSFHLLHFFPFTSHFLIYYTSSWMPNVNYGSLC
jgi:hypothetical protein